MKLEFTAREANAARRVMGMAAYHSIDIEGVETASAAPVAEQPASLEPQMEDENVEAES